MFLLVAKLMLLGSWCCWEKVQIHRFNDNICRALNAMERYLCSATSSDSSNSDTQGMGKGKGQGELITLGVAMTPTGDISVMPQECRTSTPMLQPCIIPMP